MSLDQLPRIDTAHTDDNGDIQFFTADGSEGVITEFGSYLVNSVLGDLVSYESDTVSPEDEYVEPAERPKPMAEAVFQVFYGGSYENPRRGAGHVSKIRK